MSDRAWSFGELEQDRYRALVEALVAGGRTRAQVGVLLSIRPDHLTRVMSGVRRASAETRMRAANALGFDHRYFTDPGGLPWFEWRGPGIAAEIAALRALDALDDAARGRVLAYARSRWPS